MNKKIVLAISSVTAAAVATIAAIKMLKRTRPIANAIIIRSDNESFEDFKKYRESLASEPSTVEIGPIIKSAPFDYFHVAYTVKTNNNLLAK